MAHNNSVVFGHLGDALDAIGDPGSIQPLIAQLNGLPDDGRVRISMGLAGFGAPAIDPLIAALSSRDANVRQGAADALGRASDYKLTRDPRAIAVLNAAMAARNREIVSAAYYYFAQRREPGDEDFLIRLLMEAGEREGFSMASYCPQFAAAHRSERRQSGGRMPTVSASTSFRNEFIRRGQDRLLRAVSACGTGADCDAEDPLLCRANIIWWRPIDACGRQPYAVL